MSVIVSFTASITLVNTQLNLDVTAATQLLQFSHNPLTLSLLRVINVKIPLQPHKKYDITQYGELDFS